jgi:hypothetical protein
MAKPKQSEHSVFAFSASPRWIPCPGSMAYPENLAEYDAGEYADEGTAAHLLASLLLKSTSGMKAEDWIGKVIKGGKREFTIDEDFAMHVQTYVDDVQRRALGGYLMVEQRVTLNGIEGFDESNYGTSDAIIAFQVNDTQAYGVVEDLKFGTGEKVYAWDYARADSPFVMERYLQDESALPATVVPNYQLMMYALAALADLRMLVDGLTGVLIVINQPRVGNLSELWVPVAVLERFALFAAEAYKKASFAKVLGRANVEREAHNYLKAGEKQCRWCRVADCKARDAKVAEEAGADFDIIAAEPPAPPVDTKRLAKAMAAIPFIQDWCRAVQLKVHGLVENGIDVLGVDGKPYKFVEGDLGDRKWQDMAKAEAALVGQLADKAYQPKKLLTAPAAAKILNKKKTEKLWADVFAPLITRAPGKPMLVLGSDPRPPFSGTSDSDEFEEVAGE